MKRKGMAALLLGIGALLGGCAWLVPPAPPPTPPATAPQNLAASFGTDRERITLTWSPVEGATYYEVQRGGAREGPWGTLGSANMPSLTDTVGEANEGRWFWYRVRACNAAGCGPWSEPVRGYAGRPPKPEGLWASQGDYDKQIVLTWNVMPGATYYQIFREPGPDPDCRGLCELERDVRTNFYEDQNVRAGVRYRYAIRACNGFGCSELSDPVEGCVEPCPLPFSEDEGGS